MIDTDAHSFISISVKRVDARLTDDGTDVEYAEAPERQPDQTPAHVCELCWLPMTPDSVTTPCTPRIPDDISSM